MAASSLASPGRFDQRLLRAGRRLIGDQRPAEAIRRRGEVRGRILAEQRHRGGMGAVAHAEIAVPAVVLGERHHRFRSKAHIGKIDLVQGTEATDRGAGISGKVVVGVVDPEKTAGTGHESGPVGAVGTEEAAARDLDQAAADHRIEGFAAGLDIQVAAAEDHRVAAQAPVLHRHGAGRDRRAGVGAGAGHRLAAAVDPRAAGAAADRDKEDSARVDRGGDRKAARHPVKAVIHGAAVRNGRMAGDAALVDILHAAVRDRGREARASAAGGLNGAGAGDGRAARGAAAVDILSARNLGLVGLPEHVLDAAFVDGGAGVAPEDRLGAGIKDESAARAPAGEDQFAAVRLELRAESGAAGRNGLLRTSAADERAAGDATAEDRLGAPRDDGADILAGDILRAADEDARAARAAARGNDQHAAIADRRPGRDPARLDVFGAAFEDLGARSGAAPLDRLRAALLEM